MVCFDRDSEHVRIIQMICAILWILCVLIEIAISWLAKQSVMCFDGDSEHFRMIQMSCAMVGIRCVFNGKVNMWGRYI